MTAPNPKLKPGSIITRQCTFSLLTDKEKECLAEGFSDYIYEVTGLDNDERDTMNLLAGLNPWITFYRLEGKEKFKMHISKKVLAQKLKLQ